MGADVGHRLLGCAFPDYRGNWGLRCGVWMNMRFGIVVLVLVIAYCGFLLWRLRRRSVYSVVRTMSPAVTPVSSIPDVATIKADLCRLARAEKAFFASTGHYASEAELHEDGNTDLPLDHRMPYHYRIVLPVPDSFVIVASPRATSEGRIPAFVVDERLQVCVISAGGPSQQPRSATPTYNCEKCELRRAY